MEQQEITAYAAITISGPLVYHLIRWNVENPLCAERAAVRHTSPGAVVNRPDTVGESTLKFW